MIPASKGDFTITTDQKDFDFERLFQYLSKESYWAEGIPMSVLKKAISNSMSFALFFKKEQIGFARVITDYSTFGYLADVFIIHEYRGQGLSRWLMDYILAYPELQGFRRWLLATRDAHGLYAKYGFTPLSKPDRMMEITRPDIYKSNVRPKEK